MMTRRQFLSSSLALSAAGFSGTSSSLFAKDGESTQWFMPDEADPHTRTWMAFGASAKIWGKDLLPYTRNDLALIANTIAKYEPVSMLVRKNELKIARQLLSDQVNLLVAEMDDLWMRDTSAIFVITEDGRKAAINFNFNGWGEKQTYQKDAKVASFIAKQTKVPLFATDLVLEGGCIEVDGHGTAIITESCVLNSNRNPGVSKAQLEDELMPLLGLDKIVWLPGIKGMDITDGHTDFYARFARPGVVLAGYDPDPKSFDHEVTLEHLDILKSATDASGKSFDILTLEAPSTINPDFDSEDFAAGYIGFYVCNDAVIMQKFGDKSADKAARRTLQKAFPNRTIEQLSIDGIAAGGGSIHCATQQEPAV